jgi:hypothetical protein
VAADDLHHRRDCVHRSNSMARSFPPSSATRLQTVDAVAAGVKSGRVPLKVSVAPAPRPLGSCKATARQEGSTQQEPNTPGTCLLLVPFELRFVS